MFRQRKEIIMKKPIIEKVGKSKVCLFKNEWLPFAARLEDSRNRVKMRYIIIESHSVSYQNDLENSV